MAKKQTSAQIVQALNKHLPEAQKLTVPKPVRKKRVSKKLKLVELDRPTFGAIVDPKHIPLSAYGFVYRLKITACGATRWYVGSRSIDASGAWMTYCTSSETCQRLIDASRRLPEQVYIVWEVLEYCPSASLLKIRENAHMRGMYARVGKQGCINTADPFGISLRTGKSLRK